MWKRNRHNGLVKVTLNVGVFLCAFWAWPSENAVAQKSMTWKASRPLEIQVNEKPWKKDDGMKINPDESDSSPNPAHQDSIGEARMLTDGEIILELYAHDSETGARGQTQFRYPPSHPQYDEILEHLGEMQPGERKLVPPWK